MINVQIRWGFEWIDVKAWIKKSIKESTGLMQKKAIRNAPKLSWELKKSISTKNLKESWSVYSELPYARRREYENKKNPHKKFYMKRALKQSVNWILRIFKKNLKD